MSQTTPMCPEIDYSHIPLHVRISERWKIDPEYDEAAYYKSLDRRYADRVRTVFRDWPRVPDVVLDYALQVGGQGSGYRAWDLIAGAIGMLPEDFAQCVKARASALERVTTCVIR